MRNEDGGVDSAMADEPQSEEYDEENVEPCPICGKSVNPGAAELCPHYLCVADEDGLTWFAPGIDDFRAAVLSVTSALEDFDEEYGELPQDAPEGVRDLYDEVKSSDGWDTDYWTYASEVEEVEYSNEYTMFTAYFHPNPKEFARRIKAEAQSATQWLE